MSDGRDRRADYHRLVSVVPIDPPDHGESTPSIAAHCLRMTISTGTMKMNVEGISFDGSNARAVLKSRVSKANIARILRRWTGSRRPAVLFVLVGETPFADVYAEEDLLDIFPVGPVRAGKPQVRDGTRALRVFVTDDRGTTAFVIADPRRSKGRPSKSDRKPNASDRNALKARTVASRLLT